MDRATNGVRAIPILEVEGLSVRIRDGDRDCVAVHELSFSLAPGETLAIVGESGCGKSLTAFALLGLLPANARAGGRVRLDGRDILGLRGDAIRRLRGARIAMIFQEPMTALNPVLRIGAQIVETIRAHEAVSRGEARQRAVALLAQMRIPDPERAFTAYPHQLSGGMRQRVIIAMALACSPGLLVADEPTTALDATVQADILDLIDDLRRERGLAVLLISHDLGLIGQHADRVMVMYAGRAVETRSVDDLFDGPLHPYTRGLMAARPYLGTVSQKRLTEIPGQVPGLRAVPPGCSFAPRCPQATTHCRNTLPPLEATDGDRAETGRVACHKWRDFRADEAVSSLPAA